MTERVRRSGFGQEFAVRIARAFADNDDAIVVFPNRFPHAFQERAFSERNLGEQYDVWRVSGF